MSESAGHGIREGLGHFTFEDIWAVTDRIVSLGQVGPLARMRDPETSTANECVEAAHYARERVADPPVRRTHRIGG